jgi:hypothetical protein
MKITQSHYTFWMEKRTPTPTWAASIAPKRAAVSVHDLINTAAGETFESEPRHTLLILRSCRKREGTVIPQLIVMSQHPGTVIDPHKRQAYCRRWLRRLGYKS